MAYRGQPKGFALAGGGGPCPTAHRPRFGPRSSPSCPAPARPGVEFYQVNYRHQLAAALTSRRMASRVIRRRVAGMMEHGPLSPVHLPGKQEQLPQFSTTVGGCGGRVGSAGQRPRARLLLMDRAGPPLSHPHPTGSRLRKKAGEVRGGLLEEDALQDRPADLKQLREGG